MNAPTPSPYRLRKDLFLEQVTYCLANAMECTQEYAIPFAEKIMASDDIFTATKEAMADWDKAIWELDQEGLMVGEFPSMAHHAEFPADCGYAFRLNNPDLTSEDAEDHAMDLYDGDLPSVWQFLAGFHGWAEV